ncbi:MAG: putative Pre-mRNA-splicing factor 18 [Streblomastix strix]|uniref:Pre-mRNA-splicing factor 18 n=1 Tax=Streblomastix strix TaxID=222440 RepID=A0A5J4X4H2_9EUKA|nr:MAG: putative Pre-mRNA-splicing factor 18 [Streblomastix strix]
MLDLGTSLLSSIIEKEKNKISKPNSGEKKLKTRGEIEREEYLKKQKEVDDIRAAKAKSDSIQNDIKYGDHRISSSKDQGKGLLLEPNLDESKIPPKTEIIERLRALGEPASLFGENNIQRFQRLRLQEMSNDLAHGQHKWQNSKVTTASRTRGILFGSITYDISYIIESIQQSQPSQQSSSTQSSKYKHPSTSTTTPSPSQSPSPSQTPQIIHQQQMSNNSHSPSPLNDNKSEQLRSSNRSVSKQQRSNTRSVSKVDESDNQNIIEDVDELMQKVKRKRIEGNEDKQEDKQEENKNGLLEYNGNKRIRLDEDQVQQEEILLQSDQQKESLLSQSQITASDPKLNKKLDKCEYIHSTLMKYLRIWEDELNEQEDEIKRSEQGRQQLSVYRQCDSYIKPLFKMLEKKTLPYDVRDYIYNICRYLESRDYVKANDVYLRMAIGNAPWPMGVTMVGIHERTAREKINTEQVAHILNDEAQRKYIQSVKRIMSFVSEKFPNDPSKSVGWK